MSRKQVFANLNKPSAETAAAKPRSTDENAARRPSAVRPLLGVPSLLSSPGASPVGAIGKTLGELHDRSKRADEIEQQLKSGETIVKLDPATIEPSFIRDRMTWKDAKFDSLVEAIRESGQKVPILVRPHPDQQGKYQTAYGYRRTMAAGVLEIQVDAIVREMTDEELIKAQGHENNERKDLSYIEKARFAFQLSKRFPRDFVMSTLSVHKSDLSNMLSVVEKIPEDLVEAIGPAEGAGRRQWMTLAARLSKPGPIKKATSLTKEDSFAVLSSPERLQAVLEAVKPASRRSNDRDVLRSRTGAELGHIVKSARKVTISIDRKVSPDFAEYLVTHMPKLAKEYRQGQ